MTVKIPIEFSNELIEIIVQQVLNTLDEQPQNPEPINDLPPYPTRKQIKKVLRIGDERLNQWIDNGLKVIPFGKETRFDREDIRAFLTQLKI
ncbi:helix-turn-helix domain-containing protein [Enterococcus casseliflavus]|nr:helix-turn-helix domain-containing protein [Enterococcus casseliflavus]